MYFSNIDVIRE